MAHERRTRFTAGLPQHVTLRIVGGVRSLRRERAVAVVRAAIAAGGHRGDFRVVEFNVLGNHIHLIVEAAHQVALARGMQGLAVRLARRLNAELGRRGALFAERYHARALRSPNEVRNAIRYVLLNGRHHAAERGQKLARGWMDPYSSAPWFDGWREPVRYEADWLAKLRCAPRPTADAKTWLLSEGWRRRGLIDVDDVPGAKASWRP